MLQLGALLTLQDRQQQTTAHKTFESDPLK